MSFSGVGLLFFAGPAFSGSGRDSLLFCYWQAKGPDPGWASRSVPDLCEVYVLHTKTLLFFSRWAIFFQPLGGCWGPASVGRCWVLLAAVG